MDMFIADLEKDRMDSVILMPKWREEQKDTILNAISDLQVRVDNLTASLTNEPPKDARTEMRIKQDIRTLQYRIKLENDILISNQKIHAKLDAEWNTRTKRLDKEKDLIMEELTQYYNAFTKREEPSNISPIQVIENVKSMDELQGSNKNMMEYINAVEINKDNYYDPFFTSLKGTILTQYEDECLAFQLGNPTEGMVQRTPDMNRSIQRVFDKILPTRKDIYVFRCYYSGMSVDDINNQRKLGRHTSTSLSYEYSYKWSCMDRKQNEPITNSETGSIMICIIIPKGSRVIPLTYYAQSEEYEILLSAEGKLHYTGDIHPTYKIPIFMYFDSYEKMQNYYHPPAKARRARKLKPKSKKSKKTKSRKSKKTKSRKNK